MAAVPVKCLFCKQDCQFDHREVILKEDVWICSNCPNEVAIHVHEDGHQGAAMSVNVKAKTYHISMWHPLCPCIVTSSDEESSNYNIVMKLDFTPEWNPRNIKEKLCAALIFL